jgi:hypothetical protein
VSDNIISYIEMCQREGLSLQKGMNFSVGRNHSVILMSVRPGAPYNDRLEDDGTTLITKDTTNRKEPFQTLNTRIKWRSAVRAYVQKMESFMKPHKPQS